MKAKDLQGNEYDSEKLPDMQSLLLEKIGSLNLDELKKHNGAYLLWGVIPESEKVVFKKHMPTQEHWKMLLISLNQLFKHMSNGKVKLALISEDDETGDDKWKQS